MKTNTTINYYDYNADEFYNNTINVEFASMQKKFLSKLKSGSYILDFGCGSGRDIKYFLEQGCMVDAIDGSRELCRLASEYTGMEVKHMLFQELSEFNKYNGIWACSSILHLSVDEIDSVVRNMANALTANGIIYTSFKYSEFEGERNGRYFTDFTEDSLKEFISQIPQLQIKEIWTTGDVREGRGDERWLNILICKGKTS